MSCGPPLRSTRRTSAVLLALLLAVGCSNSDDRGDRTPAETTVAEPTSTTEPTPEVPIWLATCAGEEPLVDGELELMSGGVNRRSLVALPPDFDPTEPTPVIVNLHGYGSNMEEQAAYSQFPTRGTARGYVIVTPDGTGAPMRWDLGPGADDRFVVDLLEVVDARMCVDPARVFVAGMSNGSALAGFLVCRHHERFAAAAMVAATVPPACPSDVRRPVLMAHGTADPVVPYDGGEVRSEGAGGRESPGIEVAAQSWADHDGCRPDPEVERIADDVIRHFWPDCADGTEVILYTIEEGGHTWPGPIDLAALGMGSLGSTTDSIDATMLILDFFDRHPLS